MSPEALAFDLATAHTRAVIEAVPTLEAWDVVPCPGAWSLRQQLRHLALARESVLRCLAGVDTTGLGATFDTPAWTGGDAQALAQVFAAHAERCRELLDVLDPAEADRPFTTPFGNRSTPRNYLRILLLEETHHRAQMVLTLRFLGLNPPDHPGQAWVELGVAQG